MSSVRPSGGGGAVGIVAHRPDLLSPADQVSSRVLPDCPSGCLPEQRIAAHRYLPAIARVLSQRLCMMIAKCVAPPTNSCFVWLQCSGQLLKDLVHVAVSTSFGSELAVM